MLTLADELSIELSLIPPRKRRGLVNRTLWETLRSSVIQGVLKKGSLFSAVQAARAIQQQTNPQSEQQQAIPAARILYGRLKKAPKLPSKPVLQSSSSDLSDSGMYY